MKSAAEYDYGDKSLPLWKIVAVKGAARCETLLYRGETEQEARERFWGNPQEKGYEITEITPFAPTHDKKDLGIFEG